MLPATPFPGCWWVTDRLLAGPVFWGGAPNEVFANMDALQQLGVKTIVSLVGINDFYQNEDEAEEIAWEIVPRFSWLGFALPDGEAPDVPTMQHILMWIDVGLLEDDSVYVHCRSGCGRTGTVIGCWLARHGIAEGTEVIDYLAQLRVAAGIPSKCPETEEQCRLVTSWRNGK